MQEYSDGRHVESRDDHSRERADSTAEARRVRAPRGRGLLRGRARRVAVRDGSSDDADRPLGDRADVRGQDPFAASDISEPQPDVMVVAKLEYWHAHPAHAYLVVEIARSSLRRDRGPKAVLYGLAEVDEYWIVNHVDGVVEVYRDRHDGEWQHRSTHRRGETISMLAFPDVEIAVAEILPPT